MIRTYQRTAVVKAIQFEDTPECISELSDLIQEEIRVDYADKENPVLKFDGSDAQAKVGEYIIYDGEDLYIMGSHEFHQVFRACDTPVERMVIEVDDLVEKFSKLEHFMKSDKYSALPNEMIGLLAAQYGAMLAYSQVLQIRLSKMAKENG